MGLFRDDAGRTEKPTPQRLADARDKGQVALSRELIMGGSLLAGTLALEHFGPRLVDALRATVENGLRVADARPRLDRGDVPAAVGALLEPAATIALPLLLLFGVGFTAAAASGYAQVGLHVAREGLALRPERLDPVAGLRRLFHPSAIARTALSAGKLVILFAVPAALLVGELPRLLSLFAAGDVHEMVAYAAQLALRTMFWIAVPVCALAVLDLLWQRREHVQNLMMTKQEVEDERKRSEGDPLVKRRIRAAALKLARQRMLDAVPKADVVIINPTHYSVALAYDRAIHAAPRVVAKGVDELALKIRTLAREHHVPLMQDPPLARALYRAVDVGTEIPERFYQAVAAILGHVYRLKGKGA
ncbi:MAG TPA: flagellar type III secretion system protein FlhB [Planctomycetota bacterium]|nr:flagellar type III secretion system protein FlhB [Planctomycetota bacterium]